MNVQCCGCEWKGDIRDCLYPNITSPDGMPTCPLCESVVDLIQLDPNVEAVRARLLSRATVGLKKYGTDTTRTDLSTTDWLRHLQEELLDAAVYIQRIIDGISG